MLLELDDGHSDYPIRFLLLLHQACDFSVFAFDGDRGVAFLSFFILELGFQGRFSLLERLLPFAGETARRCATRKRPSQLVFGGTTNTRSVAPPISLGRR